MYTFSYELRDHLEQNQRHISAQSWCSRMTSAVASDLEKNEMSPALW